MWCVTHGGLSVLKFGSSLLGGPDGYHAAAGEVAREIAAAEEVVHEVAALSSEGPPAPVDGEHRRRVLAVVSARRGVTDGLLHEAGEVGSTAGCELAARLVGTGEEASAALLGLAIRSVGLEVAVLGAAELGLRTEGPSDDAVPVGVDVAALAAVIAEHDVTIVPGFVGRDAHGRPTLLGRGGSDYTGLYLGARLGADEIRLVKDVDGVFPDDPRRCLEAGRKPLLTASWDDVARLGNGVVQDKALDFAAFQGLAFRVSGLGGRGTWVGEVGEGRRR